MKLVNVDLPARFSWLADQGYRLDASPYLSGAYEARRLLDALPHTQPLGELTGSGGIFHPGRISRRWVTDPDHGVPFFSSTDILEADSSFLPLIARSVVEENPRLVIRQDWTLITRSGTVGRTTYARPDVDGFACSEHVMRVVADPLRILPGYLYAFLRSRFGVPIVAGAAYGAIVQHIEPHHIADLPVPRLGAEVEDKIHKLIQEAAELRTEFQKGVREATRDLFTSAGLPELVDYAWHKQPRALGFPAYGVSPVSLRALNYDARARRITDAIRSAPHRTLGDICEGGMLARSGRFRRVAVDPGNGTQLVGQEQIFWLRPEARWIVLSSTDLSRLRAQDETVMIASQGLLTDGSLIGRAALAIGERSRRYIYSEHLLRVRSGMADFPGAYLFAFLRSEASFRIMRSLCAGTGPQDINSVLRREIPVPECRESDRRRVAELVRQAYRDRDEADRKEDRALELLEQAMMEAAG